MKWEVSGAWKNDGVDGSMIVEAANQHAAEAIAASRGMAVEQAIPQAAVAIPVPPVIKAPASEGYRLTMKIMGIAFIFCAPMSCVTGDPIFYVLGVVGGVGWLVMAMAKG